MRKITRENQPYTRWAKRDDRFLIEGVIQIIITSIILLAKKQMGFTLGLFHPTYGGPQFTPFHWFFFGGPILLVNSVKD